MSFPRWPRPHPHSPSEVGQHTGKAGQPRPARARAASTGVPPPIDSLSNGGINVRRSQHPVQGIFWDQDFALGNPDGGYGTFRQSRVNRVSW